MNEWWNAFQGNLIGAIGGSTLGLFGALLGTVGGICANRGIGRSAVGGGFILVCLACITSLIAGLVALGTKQPYHVWYPLLLIGGIGTLVFGTLTPVILGRYRFAEARRMEAEQLRRG